MENKCRILRSYPHALSFIRRCLILSPTERSSTSELLSASDYLHECDFHREKGDLLDRIRRFNLPLKNALKSSKSTSDSYKYRRRFFLGAPIFWPGYRPGVNFFHSVCLWKAGRQLLFWKKNWTTANFFLKKTGRQLILKKKLDAS